VFYQKIEHIMCFLMEYRALLVEHMALLTVEPAASNSAMAISTWPFSRLSRRRWKSSTILGCAVKSGGRRVMARPVVVCVGGGREG